MSKGYIHIILFACAMLVGCADELTERSAEQDTPSGLLFSVSTTELGDEVMAIGRTRAGAPAAMSEQALQANRFVEHPLEGDNPWGLKVQRQPLPLVGIHSAAVSVPAISSQAAIETRAAANEIVLKDISNFHDSLTIWGYTDQTAPKVTLFDQILLTKVRNWRNSVEWPYGQGDYMRFYAVSPSLETVNISASGSIGYDTPPTLTYTLPEEATELQDVLYGESEVISIASGPAGSVTTNPKEENLGKDNKFVTLNFRHITTAIRFSQGVIPENLRIREISLQGVYTKGVFHPATNDAATNTTGTWDGQAIAANYSIESKVDDSYLDGGKVLFMIPQTLPSSAKLQIKLVDTKGTDDTVDDKEHTVECSLTGDVWKKGYTVNYKITIGELEEGYYFETESTTGELEHSNVPVSGSATVHSYHLYNDYSSGTVVPAYRPVTWQLADEPYSTDGTTFDVKAPTWLTDFHGVLTSGGTDYEGGRYATASFTLARQEMTKSTSHDVVLDENSGAGYAASGLDLSTHYPYRTAKGATETANCYIINRKGSYNFPLVYGNKATDGAEPACFKDHTGTTIAYRRIEDQMKAKNPAADVYETIVANESRKRTSYTWEAATNTTRQTLRPVLLWQDVDGLITGVGFNSTEINFTIGKAEPGNAVIALQGRKETEYQKSTDSGETWSLDTSQGTGGYEYGEWETLWTWHIWMTDEVYRNEGQEDQVSFDAYYVNGSKDKDQADHVVQLKDAYDANTAQILPVNLGWVPDEIEFGLFEKREVWVKLKQTTSNKTATVKITQHARQSLYTGTGTIYQWGRPTAFPAFRTIDGARRTIYDIDGNDITDRFTMEQSTGAGDAIANPYKVLQWTSNADAWFDVGSTDYATANAMWNSTTKTVYDPCPPGFRVPPVNTFTEFSKTGATVQSGAGQLNMWPETIDAAGTTQKSGERLKGGYFYCKPHTGDIPAGDRYEPMVYMPATGEFHGNKTVGTMMSDASYQLNQINGIFWTSDYKNDATSKCCFLWITPEQSFSAGTEEKPVIGFFDTDHKQNYYGSLRGIRPMKK